MHADIVIGSNFGDEGKGHIVDLLSAKHTPIVVRFSGGAQAGHTVVREGTCDKFRHVFHHFGAGTLRNAPTLLTDHFIVNPHAFVLEYNKLYKIFSDKMITQSLPKMYCHENCQVTTPFDVLYNHTLEYCRGDNRHGSCGMGINATIDRAAVIPFTVKNILNRSTLQDIRTFYLKKIIDENLITEELQLILSNDDLIDDFIDDCKNFNKFVIAYDDNQFVDIIHSYDNVIFEGSQGLELDQNNLKYFPHLTRANTGLRNIENIINRFPGLFNELDIHYLTRPYITRHGNGPLPHEVKTLGVPIVDETNIPNEFQGTLRFGLLDIDSLVTRIKRDINNFDPIVLYLQINPKIILTCEEHLDMVAYVEGNLIHISTVDELSSKLCNQKI